MLGNDTFWVILLLSYLWLSDRLFGKELANGRQRELPQLIPFYSSHLKRSSPKLIIGHFISYDRARVGDEYLPQELKWVTETSLNGLVDVFKFYCKKDPPQNKDKRAVFEKGAIEDVVNNLQELATYCATDVLMTFEVFRELWPQFKKRFPHPVTLGGLLEMGSMYLPVNQSWIRFQREAEKTYTILQEKQREMLKCLAEDALRRHSGPSKTWYRELIPKPIKENYMNGPSLITAQMKIAPKLLRLCWQGLPLHFDRELDKRLLGLTAPDSSEDRTRSAYHQRVDPDQRDALLLEELRRSIEVMPLDADVISRLLGELRSLQGADPVPNRKVGSQRKRNMGDYPIYEYLWDLQVKGASFWKDKDRYETQSAKRFIPKSRKRLRKGPIETINPEISTCWFHPLPHEAGEGLPVGSPLSRPFQVHIAAGRLRSAPLEMEPSSTATVPETAGLANDILRDRIRASFWQSYSKRITLHRKTCLLPKLDSHDPTLDISPAILALMRWIACIILGVASNSRDALEEFRFGAILPQVVAAGTISRRAVEPLWLTASNADAERLGSEIKAMVQSPPGYSIVGADVDSQEMWIASLIGDSTVGFQGGTPYGWMTLEGSKAKGTDLHTKTAQLIGISRTEAKILNYARLYGSGMEFTKHLLSKFQTNLRPEEADAKAEKLMRATKGQRVSLLMDDPVSGESTLRYAWKGGTESAVFNALEAIARSPQPCTPVLRAQITRALVPAVVKNDISNLLTRSFFAYQLGMRDLPESVAYFSSVDIDTCLRKDPTDDCKTPSNPEGLHAAYGIPPGQSLSMVEVIRRTGGQMKLFSAENEPADEISGVRSKEKTFSS
ncbi:unnamed protein product [Schistocephalus solidus]|uniref:Mitochondrial DNA polymerase catalytic subunit n=1 Tax=Schistocephalus solidus TaxID=70667 RepID=A0A183SUF8_SCHSO|nr:unnamed protein product [Schistocephalus solidus]